MLVLPDGSCPFEEWYDGLRDRTARVRIRARLTVVRRGSLGLTRPVGDGVFEFKIDYGPGYGV
jgi:putative addiction module killer protein